MQMNETARSANMPEGWLATTEEGVCRQRGKLLFVAPSAYPLGGLATWLDYLVPGLRDKGWKITIGLTAGKFHNVDAYQKIHPFDKVVEIGNVTGSREGRIRSLCRAIQDICPDIVVGVNIPDTYAAVERLRSGKGRGPRVVMTIHGIQPDIYEDAGDYRSVLDAVICTNKLACRLVREEAALEEKRIYYAPYGVELSDNHRQCSSGGPLRIAYSGRLDHFQKRVDDIPKILLLLKHKGIPFEFIVAGGGPAEPALKEQLAFSGLSDVVRFLGVLSYTDLVEQVYRFADILLVTSLWETGPIVIWEAMAYGIAVVTSSYIGSGMEGSLKNNENCLLFPVGDIQTATECIEYLADPGVRRSIAKGGYRLVEDRYSRERSVEEWDGCFRKILDAPTKHPASQNRTFPPTGRLDRLFGNRIAEDIRTLTGRRFTHTNPGGEWPHSYGMRQDNDALFWKKAKSLDRCACQYAALRVKERFNKNHEGNTP